MATYRAKVAHIQAEQWLPGKTVDGLVEQFEETIEADGSRWPAYAIVKAPGGLIVVNPRHYVVTDAQGNRHTSPPAEFEATYERVEAVA